ncbi:MAG: response regulator [Chloroflexi bacterium]|nr:response regulator [Chloroflexota bacterium]
MPEHPTSKPVVLIADDEFALRRLVYVTLESSRYHIVEAASGDEALRLAQQHQPAIALLDISMPGLSGIEVAQAITADPVLSGTKIIFLTGLAHPTVERAAFDAGANHFLRKPFSPLQLLDLVDQIMGPADDPAG